MKPLEQLTDSQIEAVNALIIQYMDIDLEGTVSQEEFNGDQANQILAKDILKSYYDYFPVDYKNYQKLKDQLALNHQKSGTTALFGDLPISVNGPSSDRRVQVKKAYEEGKFVQYGLEVENKPEKEEALRYFLQLEKEWKALWTRERGISKTREKIVSEISKVCHPTFWKIVRMDPQVILNELSENDLQHLLAFKTMSEFFKEREIFFEDKFSLTDLLNPAVKKGDCNMFSNLVLHLMKAIGLENATSMNVPYHTVVTYRTQKGIFYFNNADFIMPPGFLNLPENMTGYVPRDQDSVLEPWQAMSSVYLDKAARHASTMEDEEKECFALKDEYEAVLELEPTSTLALNALANIYFLSGDTAKAHSLVNQSLKINKNDFMTWYMLARTEKGLGEMEKSLRSYLKSLELAPKDLLVLMEFAEYLKKILSSPKEKARFKNIKELEPKIFYNLANRLLKLQQFNPQIDKELSLKLSQSAISYSNAVLALIQK